MIIVGDGDNMELELMNIFHLYDGDKFIVIRANMTKKQLSEELKAFEEIEPMFKHVKFKMLMHQKGYKFYYENI